MMSAGRKVYAESPVNVDDVTTGAVRYATFAVYMRVVWRPDGKAV